MTSEANVQSGSSEDVPRHPPSIVDILKKSISAVESDRAELIKSREECKAQLEQITRPTEDRAEQEKRTIETIAAWEKVMKDGFDAERAALQSELDKIAESNKKLADAIEELKENLKTKEEELGRANDLIAELKKDQLELAKLKESVTKESGDNSKRPKELPSAKMAEGAEADNEEFVEAKGRPRGREHKAETEGAAKKRKTVKEAPVRASARLQAKKK